MQIGMHCYRHSWGSPSRTKLIYFVPNPSILTRPSTHDGGFDWLSGTWSFFGSWDLRNVPVDARWHTTSDVKNAWERFFNWSRNHLLMLASWQFSGTFLWIKNWVIFKSLNTFISDLREHEHIPPIVSDTFNVSAYLETIVILLHTGSWRQRVFGWKAVERRVSDDKTDRDEKIALSAQPVPRIPR